MVIQVSQAIRVSQATLEQVAIQVPTVLFQVIVVGLVSQGTQEPLVGQESLVTVVRVSLALAATVVFLGLVFLVTQVSREHRDTQVNHQVSQVFQVILEPQVFQALQAHLVEHRVTAVLAEHLGPRLL